MLKSENDYKQTLFDRIVTSLLTKRDKETNQVRLRNIPFAQRILLFHGRNKFERDKKLAYKFSLITVIDYIKEFAKVYREENKIFCINISRDQTIELQIIHPYLMEENVEEFGFTIWLALDEDDPIHKKQLKKLEVMNEFELFIGDKDDSLIYFIDCGIDFGKIDRFVKLVLTQFFEYENNDEILIDHFEYGNIKTDNKA